LGRSTRRGARWGAIGRRCAAPTAACRPLPAFRLPGRNSRLVLPAVAALLEIGERGEFRHRVGVDVWQAEHDRLDAGEGEAAVFERRRGATQAAVEPLNDLIALGPVGGGEDRADLAGRPYEVTTGALGARIDRRQRYAAEAYSVGVAGQACPAPFHQPKRPGSLNNHVKLPSQ
jgi:hypothetical protein